MTEGTVWDWDNVHEMEAGEASREPAQVLVIEPEQWEPPTGEIEPPPDHDAHKASFRAQAEASSRSTTWEDRPTTAGSRGSRPQTEGRPGTGSSAFSEPGSLSQPAKVCIRVSMTPVFVPEAQ